MDMTHDVPTGAESSRDGSPSDPFFSDLPTDRAPLEGRRSVEVVVAGVVDCVRTLVRCRESALL